MSVHTRVFRPCACIVPRRYATKARRFRDAEDRYLSQPLDVPLQDLDISGKWSADLINTLDEHGFGSRPQEGEKEDPPIPPLAEPEEAGSHVSRYTGATTGQEGRYLLRIRNFVRTFRPGTHVPPWSLEPEKIHGTPPTYMLRRIRGPTRLKWRYSDPYMALGIDPRRETGNVGLIRHFLGDTGRIMGRAESGLSPPSQAKLRKATHRARAFGLTPYFSNRGAATDSWDAQRAEVLLKGARRSRPTS